MKCKTQTCSRKDIRSLTVTFGEGNGTPLQCSCLENPRGRGAWWAAVYGVAQSWTWLKWLSSSSSSHHFISWTCIHEDIFDPASWLPLSTKLRHGLGFQRFSRVFYIASQIDWQHRLVHEYSLIAQLVKNLPAMQETPVQFLGWQDPLEKG